MAVAKFSGLASGIDSAALIDAVIEARQQPNVIRKKNVDFINSENDALEELNTKLLNFRDLLDKFRTLNNGGVSRKASSSNTAALTASATSAANVGSIGINVTSVASAGTASFNDTYATTTQAFAPNAVGTQTIGVDIGTGADLVSIDVNITSATTVEEYVNLFNANSNAAGRASAAIVNVGTSSSPSHKVVITSLQSGTNLGTITFDVPTAGAGFGGFSDLQGRTTDQATNAVFTVDGISGNITRSGNSVSDVFEGVTFNILATGASTVSVTNDVDTTLDNFKELVEAYNDIVNFVKENGSVERTEEGGEITNIYGTLAKTGIDDDFLAQFRSAFAASTSTTGTAVLSFADMGLSTNRDGTLALDEDEFREAVASDPTGATQVMQDLADAVGSTGGVIDIFTRFEGTIDIAQRTNRTEIDNTNSAIAQLDRNTERLRESLEGQFTNLETVMARLQSQQAQLTSILAGLG